MEVVLFSFTFVVLAALVVAGAVRLFLRTETVGEVTVPAHGRMLLKTVRLRILREPAARDDAAVFIGLAREAYARPYEIGSREALQLASWLEMGCERSGDLGALGYFRVTSTFEKDHFMVELTRSNYQYGDVHARLAPAHAKLVAQWLRIAAAPGRTLAEARRRSPKAPA